MRAKLLLALLPLALSACQTVPATHVKFDRVKGTLELISPKQVTAEGIVITVDGDKVSASIKKIESVNDAQVLANIVMANMDQTRTLSENGVKSLQILESIAAKGAKEAATGGVAP